MVAFSKFVLAAVSVAACPGKDHHHHDHDHHHDAVEVNQTGELTQAEIDELDDMDNEDAPAATKGSSDAPAAMPVDDATMAKFMEYDEDKDGHLAGAEVGRFIGKMMWDMSAPQRKGQEYMEIEAEENSEESDEDKQHREMMRGMDADKDGKLTYDEYMTGIASSADDSFLGMLDTDGNGTVEPNEFQMLLSMMSQMPQGGHEDVEAPLEAEDDDDEVEVNETAVEVNETATEEEGQCKAESCAHDHAAPAEEVEEEDKVQEEL